MEFANETCGSGVRFADFEVFDDGGGPSVYAAVAYADNIYNDYKTGMGVVRWDGQRWSRVGGGIPEQVAALASADDGSGRTLYVCGSFAARVMKLVDGHWISIGSDLGPGEYAAEVFDLLEFDDGHGPRLYAAGKFSFVGGQDAFGVARWDGHSWSPVGTGPPSLGTYPTARVLTAYTDRTGPALFVGGLLYPGDGAFGIVNGLARWDGTSWSSVETGFAGALPSDGYLVSAMCSWDEGDERPALFVAGSFRKAGGNDAPYLARWDGADSWTPVGSPLASDSGSPVVQRMTVFDDGTGGALIATGRFAASGDVQLANIGKWDGAGWDALDTGLFAGSPPGGAFGAALAVFDDGRGPALVVGGGFARAGTLAASSAARWSGENWSDMGVNHGVDGRITAMARYDGGSGESLYAMGGFDGVGGRGSNGVVRSTPQGWENVGDLWTTAEYAWVSDSVVFDDGRGPRLYVGGLFDSIAGVPARGVASWNGEVWAAAGDLADWDWLPQHAYVSDLGVFDLGDGPALYACGVFSGVGGVAASSIARWDGNAWSPLGVGIGYQPETMDVFDSGSGPELYVGNVNFVGEKAVKLVAKWDGAQWSEVGGGVEQGDAMVSKVLAWNDGSGEALFVVGRFRKAGGQSGYRGTAKWTGTEWVNLPGLDLGGEVRCLAGFDLDGEGLVLLAGGSLSFAGSHDDDGLGKWDGQAWSPVSLSFTRAGDSADFMWPDVGERKASLWLSGRFHEVSGVSSYNLARFTRCPCPADCDLSGSLDLLDYLCFSALFDSDDPAADCDGSGALDLFDFLCFVNSFNAGCP